MARERIFISYRREDAEGHAGRLFDLLSDHFGRDSIFMDVDTISPGTEFPDAIREKLAESDIVVVLIGPRWLSCVDKDNGRRLDDEEDWVRREIAIALQREAFVVPVLVGGATVPASDELPAELCELVDRQTWELNPATFRQDVETLIARLKKALKEQEDKHRERERKKRAQIVSEQIDEYKKTYFPLRPFEYPWWVLFISSAILLSAFASIVYVPIYFTAAVHLNDAEQAIATERFDDAIKELEEVLKLDPSSKNAKLEIAYAFFSRGENDDYLSAMQHLDGIEIAEHDWKRLTSVMPPEYHEFFATVDK